MTRTLNNLARPRKKRHLYMEVRFVTFTEKSTTPGRNEREKAKNKQKIGPSVHNMDEKSITFVVVPSTPSRCHLNLEV